MKELKVKKFQYANELSRWVNSEKGIEIVSITSGGLYEGEGYVLFYNHSQVAELVDAVLTTNNKNI